MEVQGQDLGCNTVVAGKDGEMKRAGSLEWRA